MMLCELATEERNAPWEKIFGPATHCASQALELWTDGRAALSLDCIEEVPLGEFDLPDAGLLLNMVLLNVVSETAGQLVLLFDDRSAAKLVSILLQREAADMDAWGELERSVLCETGNILGSALLNTMMRLTGRKLMPSPPALIRDFAGSVIEQAMTGQAMFRDRVVMYRMRFHCGDSHWSGLFVPSYELLESLRASLATSVTSPN